MALKLAVEILRYVSLVAYVALALATINQWRRQRDRAAAWAALCFRTLGLVVVLGQRQIVPEHPSGFAENFLQRLDIAFLLLFPYLLHRFTTVFRRATSRLESALGLMTVAMIDLDVRAAALSRAGEPRSAGFIALPRWFPDPLDGAFLGRGNPALAGGPRSARGRPPADADPRLRGGAAHDRAVRGG